MIEGAWGLGEYVVQGTVTPDNFLVRKSDLSIVRKQINRKPIELVQKEDGGVEERKVSDERANAPAITDEQVKELARIALAIEKHYGCTWIWNGPLIEEITKSRSYKLVLKPFGHARKRKNQL